MVLYNHNIFGIDPNSSKVIFDQSSGIFPESFKNHFIFNVGRTDIYAETIYGTAFGWIGNAGSAAVKAGDQAIIDNGDRSYYRIGLKIHNKTNTRAIIYAAYTNGSSPGGNDGAINIDYNNIIKKLVVFGVKFVPDVGPTLSGLLSAFWPENKPNIWEQIRNQVQELIDKAVLDAINGILSGDIRQYQERIKVLDTQINSLDENLEKETAAYYMNLAQDMVGLEFKFTFPENKSTGYALLTLYSAVVMMKMNYYSVGISKAKEIGITDRDVEDIKKFADRLIQDENGVIAYLTAMYKERVDHIYDTWDPRDIYNTMMNTRSYVAVNGLEYIPVWKNMLKDPSSTSGPYVDTVTYSECYGRITPKLCKEGTPEFLSEPLTPKVIDGKRNKLTAVELHIWRINSGQGASKIGGLKVFFEDGNSYHMGYNSSETHYVDFKDANLDKLRVAGNGALDTFTFYFSDGRKETYGTESAVETVFELKEHYIASMFLSNDSNSLAGQGANIAVSYLQK